MAGATVHIHCRRVDFEKWHALGNDYLIVEASALPFELTPARVRKLCAAAHRRVRRRRAAALRARPVRVRRPPADLQPGRLRGRAVGQWSTRGGALPAPVRVDRPRQLLDPDRGRRDPPHDHLADRLPPRARPGAAAQRRLPVRIVGRVGELYGGGRRWRFRHVQVGNPQCAIRVVRRARATGAGPGGDRPGHRAHELFPNRTNVSWYAPLDAHRIRARIFERGVGETSASGTGATGAAVAHVLGRRRVTGDGGPRRRRARGRGQRGIFT